MQDIETILNNDDVPKNVKVSALIKRATLHMQLDNSEMAFNDFNLALNVHPTCGDIYHHRGQVLYILILKCVSFLLYVRDTHLFLFQ